MTIATAPAKTELARNLTEIDSQDEIPDFANDEEAALFWETHGPSEPFFATIQPVLDHGLPPARPREVPTSIRFDPDTLTRVRALAARRGLGYQTLMKQFVCERLYEEEKREGIPS